MSQNLRQTSADPDDDSLEYFIKFPQKNDDYNQESDFVFVYNNENNPPIVIILGWAGCKEKYLKKYSKIYEDRGLITIRYTAPVECLFWKRQTMKILGEKVLNLIFDMNFETHPLIFHVFSNGGAFTYQHIILAMKNSNRNLRIRGTIFDSAPGERRFTGLYRAVSAIYGREKPLNSFASFCISMTLLMMWLVEDSYRLVRKFLNWYCDPVQSNPMQDLKDEPSSWPQLFLYSKEDDIIPYRDVECFARYRQEKRGVDVQMVCFDKSDHVKHYICHPRQYVQSVCRFINECLSYYPSTKSD